MSTTKLPWADQPFKLIDVPKSDGGRLVWMAAEMAHSHNALLRGLNSIYLQCDALETKQDEEDILHYIQFWSAWITEHHHAEETTFFPGIEKIAKEHGVPVDMHTNVEQHHIFEPGLRKLDGWAAQVLAKERSYEAAELRSMIDSFGESLQTHLKDEIPTLLSLDRLPIEELYKAYLVFELELRNGPKHQLYPLVMGTADQTHGGGNLFPVVPFFVPYLIHYYYERQWSGVWRFNPSTTWSQPRPLWFLEKKQQSS